MLFADLPPTAKSIPTYPRVPPFARMREDASIALCQLVASITAAAMDLSPADILGPDRRRRNAHARAIAMYLAHVGLGLSLAQVGRGFGRHHSTVAHACRIVEEMRDDRVEDGRLDFLEYTACWAAYGWGLGR